jgi:hypothetical protein
MRGRVSKVFPTHFHVWCDELDDIVIVSAFDIRPIGMAKNLSEMLSNSNGDWAQGCHVDFDICKARMSGRYVAKNVLVSFQGR